MHELKFYFKKIHHQLESGLNQALRKYGLTSTQYDVLAYLSRHAERPCTLTDIAAFFGVRHTSIIHVLKLLEQKGFIRRDTSGGTRSKPVVLTDCAASLISDISHKGVLVNACMFRGIPDEEVQLLEKILKQITANLESDDFKSDNLKKENFYESEKQRNRQNN